MQLYSIPEEDLSYVSAQLERLWPALAGQRIFITGGTGFFGIWLIESFLWSNQKLGLNGEIAVLTRDPDRFLRKFPHLRLHKELSLIKGDVKSVDFPDANFSYFIHAANLTPHEQDTKDRARTLTESTTATERILEIASKCKAKSFLFTSSGAIYGKQPEDIPNIGEDSVTEVNSFSELDPYGASKLASENLCKKRAIDFGISCKIARCFTFIGPHLPLNSRFAAGKFIAEALTGGPIRFSSKNEIWRSYLYAADLAVWLWTILIEGVNCRPYNVGSSQPIELHELASLIANQIPGPCGVEFLPPLDKKAQPLRYVPSVKRAELELNLVQRIELDEAVRRTLTWHSKQSAHTS